MSVRVCVREIDIASENESESESVCKREIERDRKREREREKESTLRDPSRRERPCVATNPVAIFADSPNW